MRIPKNLKHLFGKKEDSLLLVAGKQSAVIYKKTGGYLEKLDAFKLTSTGYRDTTEKSLPTGKKKSRGKGSHRLGTKKTQDKDTIRDFAHVLMSHLKNVGADKIPSIYLFTPSYIKHQLIEALPTELRRHIRAVVEGNYFNLAPSELMLKLA